MLTIIVTDETWKEVEELAREIGVVQPVSFYTQDDSLRAGLCKEGRTVLDRVPVEGRVVIAGVDPLKREAAWEKLQGFEFATLVHPESFLHPSVQVGKGSIVFRGVIGYPEGVIEENCVLLEYSSVSHNSLVGAHSVLMEKVTMGGWSVLGKRNLLKPNSVTKEKITLADDVTAETGSVILSDIPEGQSVSGNPAHARRRK